MESETPKVSLVKPAAAVCPAEDYSFTYVPKAPHAPAFDIQAHDSLFAWLSLIFGFLFVRFVAVYADGFVTTGVFLLLHTACMIYMKKSGCKILPVHRLMSAVIIAFSFVFSITASALLHGLNFVFLMCAQVWQVTAIGSGTGFVTRFLPYDLSDSALEAPFRCFGAGKQAMSESVRRSNSASAVKTVLIGLLVTFPLTGLVGGLLANADSGVENMLHSVGSLLTDHVWTTLLQIAAGIPVGCWFFGMVYAAADRAVHPLKSEAEHESDLHRLRIIPNLGLYAGVTPICVLYLLYVISQTNYFLSAFAGRLPADMIYSEYARRGFFELCAIAVINLLVILVLTGCAVKGGAERPKALTFYAVMLSAFTLFILATAFAKMLLYIGAYGLTPLRLYTSWFMVLLAVVFLVVTVRQFTRRIPSAAILTTAFTVLFALLCFSRPEALIAEYNISRYEHGTLSELDYPALLELSEDALLVLNAHSGTLRQMDAEEECRDAAGNRIRSYEAHPDRSWNLSAQLLKAQAGS